MLDLNSFTITDFILVVSPISIIVSLALLRIRRLVAYKNLVIVCTCFMLSNIFYWYPVLNGHSVSEYLMWATIFIIGIFFGSLFICFTFFYIAKKICNGFSIVSDKFSKSKK